MGMNVPFRGGEDHRTPRALAPPGSLRESFNYEIGTEDGYTRIDGFERFDGRMSPSNTDIWELTLPASDITGTFQSGENLSWVLGDESGDFGVVSRLEDRDSRNLLLDSRITKGPSDASSEWTWDDALGVDWSQSTVSSLEGVSNQTIELAYAGGTQRYGYQTVTLSEGCRSIVWRIFTRTEGTATEKSLECTLGNQVVIIKFAEDGSADAYVGETTAHEGMDVQVSSAIRQYGDDALSDPSWPVPNTWIEICVHMKNVTEATSAEIKIGPWSSSNTYPGVGNAELWRDRFVSDVFGEPPAYSELAVSNKVLRVVKWASTDVVPDGATVTGDTSGASFTYEAGGVSDGSYDTNSVSVSAYETSPDGLVFSPSGMLMFICGAFGNVQYWRLTTPWDLTTASFSGATPDIGADNSLRFSSDGFRFFFLNGVEGVVQYDLPYAWDPGGGFAKVIASDISEEFTSTYAVEFSFDGSKMYLLGSNQTSGTITSRRTAIREYNLPEAWNVASRQYTGKEWFVRYADGSNVLYAIDMQFDLTGSLLYILDKRTPNGLTEKVVEFHLGTPWDIDSAYDSGNTLSVSSQNVNSKIFVQAHGRKLFGLSKQADAVYRYSIGGHKLSHISVVEETANLYAHATAASAAYLRTLITPVPGTGPTTGVKLYKGDVYAIRDYAKINFTGGDVAEPDIGQRVVIVDGDVSTPSAITEFGSEARFIESDLTSGSWETSDGAGWVIVRPEDGTFDIQTKLGSAENTLWALSELQFTSGSHEPEFGQYVEGATSAVKGYVYRVEVTSGTWADGDAAGIIYCYNIDGVFTDGENLDIYDTGPTLDTANGATLTTYFYEASDGPILDYSSLDQGGCAYAGLYKSSRAGWVPVELPVEVSFDTGTTEPDPAPFGADTGTATVSTTPWLTPGATEYGSKWNNSNASHHEDVDATDTDYISPTTSAWPPDSLPVILNDFGAAVPEGSRIVGVEIEIRAVNADAATYDAALSKVQPWRDAGGTSATKNKFAVTPKTQDMGTLTVTETEYTFGGANDLWGTGFSVDDVNATDFGVRLQMRYQTGATVGNLQIDRIRMRIHYVESSQQVYFYDTVGVADVANGRLVSVFLESGAWDGSGVGKLQLYDMSRPLLPTTSIQIRDASAGGGNLIANLTDPDTMTHLAGSTLLEAEGSAYEIIKGNPYARDDLESLFVVNGAARGFAYDGTYVRFINAGFSPDLEKPRHVALWQNRLVLGYKWGENAFSVSGDPTGFDGTLNAWVTGISDRLVALHPLSGTSLGVFGDNRAFAINAGGVDASGNPVYDQQILAAKLGPLEYLLEDLGNTPIYLEPRGLTKMDASDVYGNFEMGRMSRQIHPWLLPRLDPRANSALTSDRPIRITTSRRKNQIRVYFADGYRLSATLTPEGAEFTRQFLYLNGDKSQYVCVEATDADVDEDQEDRLFFTMGINPDYDHGTSLGYVFEDDRGNSFDGAEFEYWFELNPIHDGNIDTNKHWSQIHTYGRSYGHASIGRSAAVDFDRPALVAAEDPNSEASLGSASGAVQTGLDSHWTKFPRLRERGRMLSLRYGGSTDYEFPHVLQHIDVTLAHPARKET